MKDYMLDPPQDASYPACPRCGSTEYEQVFIFGFDIIGCSDCIITREADEYWDEYEQDIRDRYEDMKYEEYRDN